MKPALVKFPTIRMTKEAEDGYAYRCDNGLFVIQTLELHKGKEWLHTSFSRRNRMPDYKDMKFVKTVFIGDYKRAVMLLPEQSNHVNIMKTCLHFYTGDDGLPDFTMGTGRI